MAALSKPRRAAVVAAYFLAFWMALLAGLWWAGRTIDRVAGWQRTTA